MTPITHKLASMILKLQKRGPLEQSDRDALLGLPHRVEVVEPSIYIVREGERPQRSCLLLSGFAYRQKITAEGGRQIVSVHIPGDFVDLQGALLDVSDHNVQALTRCEVAFVPREALQSLIANNPRLAAALWIDTLVDASIFREWVVNVGRRDARGRIAHLLCELARRLKAAGLVSTYSFELPMTQEQLADATGLTPVHVNRVLKQLEQDGLIERVRRLVHIRQWDSLRSVGGFVETYLHLDQAAAAAA